MRGFKTEFLILVCGAALAFSACNGILHATQATVRTLDHVGTQLLTKSGSIKETTETKTLERGDWQKLNIQNEVGEIHIVTGSKTPNLTITKRFVHPENLELKLETRGDTLFIVGKIKPNQCNNCSIDLTLNVPENLEIQLQTDVGDITVAGLLRSLDAKTDIGKIIAKHLGAASVHLQSDTGDIDLSDAHGEINLRSSIGRISADQLGNSQVKMYADTGDLTLSDVEGAIVLETNIGSIDASDIRGGLNLNTDTGDINAKNVTFEPNSSNQLGTNLGTVTLEDFNAPGGIELEGQTNLGELELGLTGFTLNQTGKLLEHQFSASRAGQNTAKVHFQTDTGSIVVRVQ
jgi:Putative adhesin